MQTFYFQIVHRHVFEGLKVEFDTIAEGGFNKFAIHKNITVVFKTDGKFLIYNTFFVSVTTLQQSLYCFPYIYNHKTTLQGRPLFAQKKVTSIASN